MLPHEKEGFKKGVTWALGVAVVATLVYGLYDAATPGGYINVGVGTAGSSLNRAPPPPPPSQTGGPTGPATQAISGALIDLRSIGNNTQLSTSNGVSIYNLDNRPDLTNSVSTETITPGSTEDTSIQTLAGQPRYIVHCATNTYCVSLGGVDENWNALPYTIPVRPTDTGSQPWRLTWADEAPNDASQTGGQKYVRYVASWADPLEENSPTSSQSINGQATLNGSDAWRVYDASANTYAGCIAVGTGSSTGADGSQLFFNNTNCNGQWYLRLDLNLGSVGFSEGLMPAIKVVDLGNNMSQNEVTQATLSWVTGTGGLHIRNTDVRELLNLKKCILLYNPSNPWVKAGGTQTAELRVSYSASLWTTGEGIGLRFVDQAKDENCAENGNLLTSTATGAAYASAIDVEVLRYRSDA